MVRALVVTVQALLALAATVGCGTGDPASTPLRVAAAASLKGVMGEALDLWNERGNRDASLTVAASSTLARQITLGAPFDLFLSAHPEWIDQVEREGLSRDGSRAVLATNRLVLIAASSKGGSSKVGSSSGADLDASAIAAAILPRLEGGERIALADPDHVPAGRFARESLTACGIWNDVSPRVIAAANVRAALRLVERGEVALGIVYATDALASSSVLVLGALPSSLHRAALVETCTIGQSADAARLATWLSSEEARAIFAKHGFGVGP